MMPGPPIIEMQLCTLAVLDQYMRLCAIVVLVYMDAIAIEAVKIQLDRFVDLREMFNQYCGGDPLSHAQ